MYDLMNDLKFPVCPLMKSPSFACVVILLFAIRAPIATPAPLRDHPTTAMVNGPATGFLPNTVAFTLVSTSTGDAYFINVYTPPSYPSGDRNYPVLYLMDGDYFFGAAVNTVSILQFSNEIPEFLIVGVGTGSDMSPTGTVSFHEKRMRDFTPFTLEGEKNSGGGDKFQQFLEAELMPRINQAFRTQPSEKYFWGASLGAIFGMHVLLEKPALFSKYVLASPAWDLNDAWALSQYYEGDLFKERDGDTIRILFSHGSAEIPSEYTEVFKKLSNHIETRKTKGYEFIHIMAEGEIHITAPFASMPRSFRAMFESP